MEFDLKDLSQEQFQTIFLNDGFLTPEREKGERLEIRDLLSTSNAPPLFRKTFSNVVKEAAEPLLVATSLLTRINWEYGQSVSFPAMGEITAGQISEGGEYPTETPSIGGATVVASIDKHGVAIRVTEEMIKFSMFDIIAMMLRSAGRAMARHKETRAFNYIRSMGVAAFDNLNPSNSLYGVTHGRNLQGVANGSIVMDDIFDAFAQLLDQGFMANTLLMHPLTWAMWVKDPQLRAFVQANGGGVFYASWNGNPAGRAPWDNSSMGGLGVSSGQKIIPGKTSSGQAAPHGQTASNLLQFPQTINSSPVLPNYMNVPFRIIVSPYIPYDPRTKLTDIYMFDSNYLGVMLVGEDLTTEEWREPMRDVQNIKMRESYGFGILEEGRPIATLKNIAVVPNEVVLPAQATIDVSATQLAPLDPGTALTL